MGLLGSALGRGIAGAGEAASGLANKYIDQELAAEKAKMIAQLQHDSAVKIDQYNLSPERQATLRQNTTDATLAQGAATRQSELAGINDTAYQAGVQGKKTADATADTDREIAKIKVMTPAQIEAVNAKTKGTMDIEAQREALIADAKERAKFNWDDRRNKDGEGDLKLPAAVKSEVDALREQEKLAHAAMTKAQGENNWDPAKNPGQNQLLANLRASAGKRERLIAPYRQAAGAANADPFGLMGDPREAAIRADMSKTGVKTANVSLDGAAVQSMTADGARGAPLEKAKPSLMERAAAAFKPSPSEQQANKQLAETAAAEVLQAPDKRAGYKVMQMPGFDLLDPQMRLRISAMVNGR